MTGASYMQLRKVGIGKVLAIVMTAKSLPESDSRSATTKTVPSCS